MHINFCFNLFYLSSCTPLELVYTKIWGLTLIFFSKGFCYYVISIDHFPKYKWLCLMKNKFDHFTNFPKFYAIVEKHFETPLVTIYFDGWGEYKGL